MPVTWRVIFGCFAWIGLLHLAFTDIPCLDKHPTDVKFSRSLVLTIFVLIALVVPIRKGWRSEKSAATEGDLTAGAEIPNWKNIPDRVVEMGDSGSAFDLRFQGGPQMKFVYDAGLRISLKEDGPAITTPIRDRDGHLIAEIKDNHWKVFPGAYDKNYTDNSLEVLDSRGLVVLQVRLLADRIQLQGEWRDEFGNGTRIGKCSHGGCLSFWTNAQMEHQIEQQLIEPLFQYPSSEHWGEFANKD
jgi:hypothetical protein